MLTRWSPFEELTTLHREMDRLFSRAFDTPSGQPGAAAAFVPAIEVVPAKEGWDARLALPGVEPKDVQIDVAGNTLTVRGERTARQNRAETYLSEITYGRFERTLSLPESIDAEKVTASYRNGMLELHLPLKESVKPRRIQIATEEKPILEGVGV
jgi:HSP20 family protein